MFSCHWSNMSRFGSVYSLVRLMWVLVCYQPKAKNNNDNNNNNVIGRKVARALTCIPGEPEWPARRFSWRWRTPKECRAASRICRSTTVARPPRSSRSRRTRRACSPTNAHSPPPTHQNWAETPRCWHPECRGAVCSNPWARSRWRPWKHSPATTTKCEPL